MTSSAHTMTRPAFPEDDELHYHLLKKIGFREFSGRLAYERKDPRLDEIALAITAMHAATTIEN